MTELSVKSRGHPFQTHGGQGPFLYTYIHDTASSCLTGQMPKCGQPQTGSDGLGTFQVHVTQMLEPVINQQDHKLASKYSPIVV